MNGSHILHPVYPISFQYWCCFLQCDRALVERTRLSRSLVYLPVIKSKLIMKLVVT